MKISLKTKSNIFEQIVNEYTKFISLGVLTEGEKIPSCRILAKELGVNPNTVEKAYSVLEEKGLIYILPKKGVYVSKNNNNLVYEETKEFLMSIKDKINYDEMLSLLKEVYKEEE